MDAFVETYVWPAAIMIGQSLLLMVCLLVFIAYILYADRKIWAAVQMRRGPNVVGPWGLFQSFADLLKLAFKEPIIPAGSDKAVFLLAPLVTVTLAMATWAVIPLNEGWMVANINVGILYVFAISSLEVYGVIMAGWASNSKYPFLGAGSNHLEAELASLLGMSRTPVREATLILEAQGLVSVIPRHGVKILSISPKDMTEIYQVLTELECLSAGLAATKNHPDEEFLVAETAIRDMEKALENEDLEAWAIADDKFHSELVRLGENQRVINIFDMYTDQVKRARMLTLRLRPIPTKSNEDHRKVLEAIRSGQSEVAVKVHKEHRIQAGQMLVNLLEKFGLSNL